METIVLTIGAFLVLIGVLGYLTLNKSYANLWFTLYGKAIMVLDIATIPHTGEILHSTNYRHITTKRKGRKYLLILPKQWDILTHWQKRIITNIAISKANLKYHTHAITKSILDIPDRPSMILRTTVYGFHSTIVVDGGKPYESLWWLVVAAEPIEIGKRKISAMIYRVAQNHQTARKFFVRDISGIIHRS